MFLKRLFEPKLAQASYLIGCAKAGEAIVIDPNRDVEQYIRAAEAEGTRVAHVTETHIHADFVSGSRELAERTGARLYLSDEGGDDWKYGYAGAAGATMLRHGDRVQVGSVLLEALHTPGHTPEHLSFLVTDGASATEPIGAATGDFVFVGDVGRPDLLERAAHVANTMEQGARTLYQSLQDFRARPDWLQIWPGHGAGSACGKGISAIPHSTLGYEKRFNWAFRATGEDAFVAAVLAGQPDPPRYFSEMKRVNKVGPRVLGGWHRPELFQATSLARLVDNGAIVIDTRHAADFAVGHVPKTINIPLNGSFTTWAGWLVPYTNPFYLIVDAEEEGAIEAVVRDLAMIGLDRIGGYFDASALDGWSDEGRPLGTIPQITAADLASSLTHGGVTLVDVRNDHEWAAGHIEGALHVPLGRLPERLDQIPRERPVIVQCAAGARSAIAASVLQAHGVDRVSNLIGGIDAWTHAGLPVV